MFNNRRIAFCNFCNIWYSQSPQSCSTFVFFNATFIHAAYLFTLLECLKYFNCNGMATIIHSLDPNKAHGQDMISICMLKKCGKPICKLLELIFQSCFKNGNFPSELKKANIVPVHQKSDKQNLKNHQTVSLLPICGNVFERLIYNNEYFIENDLISPKQSCFKPADSCTNYLIFITNEIY